MQNTDIILTPLGGGREIGANSYLLEWGGANIILDSGLNPRKTGFDALPAFDLLFDREVHGIIISHAHLDHIGSLTFLVEKYMALGAKIFLTHPTASLIPLMGMESVKQIERGRIPLEDMYYYHHYFEREIVNGLRSYFSPQEYDKAFEIVPGLSGYFFPSGHILGAGGIVIGDGDYTLVYTGDICMNDQSLLSGASLPENIKADCLVIESTYGSNDSAHKTDPEGEYKNLANEIRKCMNRKGHVLIPCFALGRAQELVMMISQMKEDKLIPKKTKVYVHKGSTEGVNRIYDRHADYLEGMKADKIAGICEPVNIFKGEGKFYKADDLASGPSVFVFTSGMMARGTPSARFAGELIQETKNAVLFTGYVAPNELGYQVLNSRYGQLVCLDIVSRKWEKVKNKHIHKFSFSAHSHREDLMNIADHFQPDLTLWVHGDEPSTRWLSEQYARKRKKQSLFPENRESVLLRLRSEKINTPFSSFRAVIITVGTSLIFSYLKNTEQADRDMGSVTRDELIEYIQKSRDISGLSAETNSLAKKAIQQEDYLYFLCGDTQAGCLCGEILTELYGQSGFRCWMAILKGLKPSAKAFHEQGMKNLIYELVRIIERHNKNAVIHATGGFKAQIALATLIGILFRLQVFYIYEDFEDVVQLPEIPLDFNYEILLASRREFFNLLDAREHWKCDEVYAGLPDMLKHCFYKDTVQARYALTPLGRAMFNAFQRQIGMRLEQIPIVVKGESSLWGVEKDAIGKILNPMIGMILERISRYYDMILCFEFSSARVPEKKGKIKENYLELIKKGADFLTYRAEHMGAVKGREDIINIKTSSSMASYLLNHIGRKIYP